MRKVPTQRGLDSNRCGRFIVVIVFDGVFGVDGPRIKVEHLLGKAQKAVLKDLQRHPAKPKLLHVDFLRVGAKDVITMHVPLHFIGEEDSPGVKEGSLVSHLMTTVDIACLASDLPEYLEVDLSNMNTGESLHLSDIPLPKGVSIPALAQGEDHDLPIASIHAPRGGGDTEEEAAEEAGEGEASED